jgi:uncharacterized protein YcgL (UPF0745 family)
VDNFNSYVIKQKDFSTPEEELDEFFAKKESLTILELEEESLPSEN